MAPADAGSIEDPLRNLSAFHLCHVFHALVGTSIYDYVVRERLAQALDAVMDSGDDISTIAPDAGFASHGHFTARFRRFFGCTPTALRRGSRVGQVAQISQDHDSAGGPRRLASPPRLRGPLGGCLALRFARASIWTSQPSMRAGALSRWRLGGSPISVTEKGRRALRAWRPAQRLPLAPRHRSAATPAALRGRRSDGAWLL